MVTRAINFLLSSEMQLRFNRTGRRNTGKQSFQETLEPIVKSKDDL